MKAVSSKSERIGGKANVCIEAANIEEAQSKGAREAALDHAKMLGMGRPGISGTPWMEWVDEKGATIPPNEFQNAQNKFVHITWPIQEGL